MFANDGPAPRNDDAAARRGDGSDTWRGDGHEDNLGSLMDRLPAPVPPQSLMAFMTMMAHELRTPLTSIKGFAQLLLRQDVDRLQLTERYARVIESESNRMIGIINDLLDVSKVEAGLLPIRKHPVDVGDVIQSALGLAEPALNGHSVVLKLSECLPVVFGDAGRIEQILSNLIGSVAKYSAQGELIEIGASVDEEGVTFWVSHESRSIPADKFDHVFNKFENVVSTSEDVVKQLNLGDGGVAAKQAQGSGLGLYIAKKLVEAHGGEIWVESENGKGAKFLFKLQSSRKTTYS